MNSPESSWRVDLPTQTNGSLFIFRPGRRSGHLPGQKLTLKNAECGVTLRIGEECTLNLGEQVWTLRARDEMILARVQASDERGQVTWRALQAGRTRLYATSDPPRQSSGPPVPKIFLEIPITVLP